MGKGDRLAITRICAAGEGVMAVVCSINYACIVDLGMNVCGERE
jgi:hypothetical protein